MTKTVKMLVRIGGTRDGVEWPEVGESCELPDHEADWMQDAGHAEIVSDVKKKATNATKSTESDAVAESEPDATVDAESTVEEDSTTSKRRAKK